MTACPPEQLTHRWTTSVSCPRRASRTRLDGLVRHSGTWLQVVDVRLAALRWSSTGSPRRPARKAPKTSSPRSCGQRTTARSSSSSTSCRPASERLTETDLSA